MKIAGVKNWEGEAPAEPNPSPERLGGSLALPVRGLAVLLGLLALNACNQRPAGRPDRASVSGAISFQGKPLRAGLVTFSLVDDPKVSASCILQPDGTYSVDDAPIGANAVAVDTKAIMGGAADRYVEIPVKYTSEGTSGLKVMVEKGENTSVDFELQ